MFNWYKIRCFIVTLVSDIRDLLTGFSSDETNSPPSGLSHWLIHCQASQELVLCLKIFGRNQLLHTVLEWDRRKYFMWCSQLCFMFLHVLFCGHSVNLR